ncbi:MAG: hypothetical protein NTU88_09825 [Armatimonadetes bacterium]|nr:hypothetical protein [Armatimonadota bacterium]
MIRSGLSQEDTPPSIGYYDLRGGNAQAYCRVPYDALPVIIAALASGHTRRLDLRGRAPRYGRGSLLDIALGLEEEEEPQAQTSVAPSPPEIIGS